MAGQRTKGVRALEDIAADIGYIPGEFQVRRLHEAIVMVRRWKSELAVGQIPADLSVKKPSEAARYVAAAEIELAKEEREMLSYFHPKKRHVEATTTLEGSLSLVDLLVQRGNTEEGS